jgi:protein SCO1
MKQVYRSVALSTLSFLVLFSGTCLAQGTQVKKSYTFHGKIESVDASGKSLKVNGEEVKGWMAAMTMDYKVDDPGILQKLKSGDQIMATVYDGDLVLHKVQVVAKQGSDSKGKK